VLDLRVFVVALECLVLDRQLAVSQAAEKLAHVFIPEPDYRAHGTWLLGDRVIEGGEFLARNPGPVVQENLQILFQTTANAHLLAKEMVLVLASDAVEAPRYFCAIRADRSAIRVQSRK
jgi:hypothetical protein